MPKIHAWTITNSPIVGYLQITHDLSLKAVHSTCWHHFSTSYSTFCYCVLEVACLIENRASIIMSHTTLWFDPNGRKWVLEVYYQCYQLSILYGQLIMFKNKSSCVWCDFFTWKLYDFEFGWRKLNEQIELATLHITQLQ